jgi:signal transduction histidine kinase
MLATASSRPNWPLGGAWAVFAAVNIGFMYAMPGRETIPFHFVWIALGLVYGFSRWSPRVMVSVLGAVTLSTGSVLVHHAEIGAIGWEEISEVPLMAAVFLAMVWHVGRRQQALAEVQRLASMDRRRLEAQQLFVRLCSHELRTPITVARGYTDLIRAAHPDPRTAEDTEIVIDELDKLNRITHRLLTLMQMNEVPPPRLVDLDAALARLIHRWEPTAERDWALTTNLGSAFVDGERLETALDCLVENAIKFTDAGGSIAISGYRDGDNVIIDVADSGSGVTPDVAEHLLTGPPGRQTATGTGLGFAIVRAAVGAWNGTVHIGNRPGGGTVMTVRFPTGGMAAQPVTSAA